ncbi:DNA cytosine methyltransferase [Pleurocapsa sp. FMAR1]|uniref:DNA cytosine methyltransferase n=1 Tax=Pleurocapsa sp. FMAR1 TaxID=3040204 RepID=UPI0029C9030B|nr:DNA cytosine methyltransferase [Pleurocapsa sp. FMAR1]
MATNDQRPIAVDLFAGAGGMTLGFEQAGFDVLAAVELDPIHASVHEYNFPFWTTICKSVTEITGREIRELSTIGDRDIDVVFGGPPCQGFSMMGKRNFDDDRNSLVSHFLRLVLDLNPKFFVMENVRGITIGKHQKILQTIIEEFKSYGYQVTENYQVLNAAHYGVPQNRRRLFLLGCRQGFTLPNYPQPLTQPLIQKALDSSLKAKAKRGGLGGHPAGLGTAQSVAGTQSKALPDMRLTPLCSADDGADALYSTRSVVQPSLQEKYRGLPPTPTVQDAIGDLPEANNYPELELRDWVIADYGQPSEYASKLRNLTLVDDDYAYQREEALRGESPLSYLRQSASPIRQRSCRDAPASPWLSKKRECKPELLTCSRRTKHTNQTIARFAATIPGTSDRISHFHRLDLNGLCTTLRAGTASNHGAFTSPRPIHPLTPRCITVREAARLHSYPDWFMLHATKWHGFRQIGNSVPPLLAKAVAQEIIKAMEFIPVRPQQIYCLSQTELLHFKMSQAEQYHKLETRAIARRTLVKFNE